MSRKRKKSEAKGLDFERERGWMCWVYKWSLEVYNIQHQRRETETESIEREREREERKR